MRATMLSSQIKKICQPRKDRVELLELSGLECCPQKWIVVMEYNGRKFKSEYQLDIINSVVVKIY